MKAPAFLLALTLTTCLWSEPLALRKRVYEGSSRGLGEAMMVELQELARVFEIDLGQNTSISGGEVTINGKPVTAEESGATIYVNVKEFAQATGLTYQWNESMSRFEVDRPSNAVVNYVPPEERPKTDRYGRKVTQPDRSTSKAALARMEDESKQVEERNRKAQQAWERERTQEEKARAKLDEIRQRGQDYEEARDPKTDLYGFKKEGRWVIRPKFKAVSSFNCGYACAKMPDTVSKRKVTEAVQRTYQEVEQTTYNGVPLGPGRPTGRTETRTEYETRTVTKTTEHKWGIISTSGEWSCSPKFDRSLTFTLIGDQILAQTYEDGKSVWYTPQGVRVSEPRSR